MLPGVNGSSASAIKSIATDRAILAGIGRGELSAWINNLRALVVAIAPVIYGQFYGFAVEHGIYPGYTFSLAALFGAVLPEIFHRMMPAKDIQMLNGTEKKTIAKGTKIAELEVNGK